MKNGFESIAKFEVPKIEAFQRKTNADATAIGSGTGRLPAETVRWERVSLSKNQVSFRWIHASFSGNQISLRWTHVSLSGNQISFRWPHVSISEKAWMNWNQNGIDDRVPKNVGARLNFVTSRNPKKRVPNFSSVSNRKSYFCAWKKVECAKSITVDAAGQVPWHADSRL